MFKSAEDLMSQPSSMPLSSSPPSQSQSDAPIPSSKIVRPVAVTSDISVTAASVASKDVGALSSSPSPSPSPSYQNLDQTVRTGTGTGMGTGSFMHSALHSGFSAIRPISFGSNNNKRPRQRSIQRITQRGSFSIVNIQNNKHHPSSSSSSSSSLVPDDSSSCLADDDDGGDELEFCRPKPHRPSHCFHHTHTTPYFSKSTSSLPNLPSSSSPSALSSSSSSSELSSFYRPSPLRMSPFEPLTKDRNYTYPRLGKISPLPREEYQAWQKQREESKSKHRNVIGMPMAMAMGMGVGVGMPMGVGNVNGNANVHANPAAAFAAANAAHANFHSANAHANTNAYANSNANVSGHHAFRPVAVSPVIEEKTSSDNEGNERNVNMDTDTDMETDTSYANVNANANTTPVAAAATPTFDHGNPCRHHDHDHHKRKCHLDASDSRLNSDLVQENGLLRDRIEQLERMLEMKKRGVGGEIVGGVEGEVGMGENTITAATTTTEAEEQAAAGKDDDCAKIEDAGNPHRPREIMAKDDGNCDGKETNVQNQNQNWNRDIIELSNNGSRKRVKTES